MKYRSHHQVVRDILTAAVGGNKITKIMYLSYTSYPDCKKYLADLVKVGLLERKNDIWITTTIGKKFIQSHDKLMGVLG